MLTEIAIGLFLLSVIATRYLHSNDKLPPYMSMEGPLLLFHSQRGLSLVERFATHKRPWQYIATLGVVVTFVGMVFGLLGLGVSASSVLLQPETTTTTQPSNYLAIPGVNDYLPLSETIEIVLALLIGVVLHEGGHAILCRVENIDIDSTGFAFISILPMGAFVEPNEESKDRASHFARARMASAGIVQNLALTVVSLVLLIAVASFLIVPSAGVPVGATYDNTVASANDLTGDRIVSVEGQEIADTTAFNTYLAETTQKSLTVTTADGETKTIERTLLITSITNTLFESGVQFNQVNGNEVYTVNELRSAAIQSETLDTVETTDGTKTVPLGAQTQLNGDEVVYVTAVNGVQIGDGQVLQDKLQTQSPEIELTYWSETESGFEKTTEIVNTNEVTQVWNGVSGIEFSETGLITYPSNSYLSILQFSETTVSEIGYGGAFLLLFLLPFLSLIPLGGYTFNFGGFTPMLENFYTVTHGPEGVVFFIATTLFWSVWLNLNLALFNSLPIWMLDGHHILRDTLHGIEERYLYSGAFRVIQYMIPLLALISLLIIVLAPVIVGVLT